MVTVTFQYEPDEPDSEDPTGVSNAEFESLCDALMQLGAQNINVRA